MVKTVKITLLLVIKISDDNLEKKHKIKDISSKNHVNGEIPNLICHYQTKAI